MRKKNAFTLLETMLVVLVVGLIVALGAYYAWGWLNREKEKNAVSLAQNIDVQKKRFLTEQNSAALSAWAAAANDEERYALLKSNLANAPANLGDGTADSTYSPLGYKIILNGLNESCSVIKVADNTQVGGTNGGASAVLIHATSSNASYGVALGGGSYGAGDTVTLNAQPFNGYQFVRWVEGASTISNDASYTFAASSARSLVAEFQVAPEGAYALTILRNNTMAGTVSPGSGNFPSGDTVSLTASPTTGWLFDSWSGDIGSASANSASIQVSMTQNRTVQANFIRASVTLSLSPNDPSRGSVSGGGQIPVGTSTTVTASPYPGFRFVQWLDGVTPISTASAFTVTVSANKTLTAEFAAEPTSGVNPGNYGSSSRTVVVAVNSVGQVTSASDTPISIAKDQVTGLGNMSDQANSSVAITGGSIAGVSMSGSNIANTGISGGSVSGSAINSSPIGATSPSTGAFTQVGVGTTSPVAKLQSTGAPFTAAPTLGSPVGAGLFVSNTDPAYGLLSGVSSTGSAWLQAQRVDGSATPYALLLQPSGGNVGVGTTSPAYKMDVNGDVNISGQFRVNGVPFSGSSQWSSNGSDIYYNLGNVGIGTNTPGAKLTVAAGDSSFASFGPNASWGASLRLGSGSPSINATTASIAVSDGNLHIDSASGHNLFLNYYNAAPTYINTQGGNVGIGSWDASQRLTVAGNIKKAGSWIASDAVWGAGNFEVHNPSWDGSSNGNYGGIVGGHGYFYGGLQSGGGSGSEASNNGELYVSSKSMLMGRTGINTTNPQNALDIVGWTKGEGEYTGFIADSGAANRRVGLVKYPGYAGVLAAGASSEIRVGHRTDTEDLTVGLGSFRTDLLIGSNGDVTVPGSLYANNIIPTNLTFPVDKWMYSVDGQPRIYLQNGASNHFSSPNGLHYFRASDGNYKTYIADDGVHLNKNLYVSTDNTTGGGIVLADDGDIVDMNDGWATHRFSYGLHINSANRGGGAQIQLANSTGGHSWFNTGNNFGIGNGNPTAKLEVTGDTGSNPLIVNTAGSATSHVIIKRAGTGQINWGSYPGAYTSGLQIQNNDNTRFIWFSPLDSGSGSNAILRTAQTGFNIMSGGVLGDGGVLGFSQDTAGNVGIGIASPGAKLDVNGTIKGRIARGSYGSLSIVGLNNGYAGIDFTDASQTLMVRNDGLSGMYRNDNTWLWGFDNGGSLFAGTVPWGRITGAPSISGTWNWSGQGGQPTWLWGSNDGSNMYVWNPSNFVVNNVNDLRGTWDSLSYFRSNRGSGSYLSSHNSAPLEVYSSDNGTAFMSFHRGGYFAVNFGLDPDNVMRIGGWSMAANRWQLDGNGNQTIAGSGVNGGSQTVNGNYYVSNYGQGMVGVYDSTRYQQVFAMSPSYMLPADGTNTGNMYGIAWTHSNVGGQSKAGLSHQALFMIAGQTATAVGDGIWTRGNVGIQRDAGYPLDVQGEIRSVGGNFRTNGGGGWYNESYGGGWYMSDSTWIRSYGEKSSWLGGGWYGTNGGLTIGYGGGTGSNAGSGAIIAGNVGIGTSSPGYKLDVAGDVRATSFNATSSRRYKDNIHSLDTKAILNKVLKMRGVSYDWKPGQARQGHDLGVIAEEVQELFPEFVIRDNNDPKGAAAGVDYGRLSSVLIEAVKGLKGENDELKQKLSETNARFDDIERRLKMLTSATQPASHSADTNDHGPNIIFVFIGIAASVGAAGFLMNKRSPRQDAQK